MSPTWNHVQFACTEKTAPGWRCPDRSMRIQYPSARVPSSGHRRFESVEPEKRAKSCYDTEGRVRQGVGYTAITTQSSVLLSR